MLGITLNIDDTDQYLDLKIDLELVEKKVEVGTVHAHIQKSEFKYFFIFDENIIEAISRYKSAKKNNSSTVIEYRIGERRDSKVKCRINADQLSAYLTITTGFAGQLPTFKSLSAALEPLGIKRGVSKKRLQTLVKLCAQALPNEVFEELIAKGLPPRVGKSSKFKPLVQNALDRILKPQTVGTARVDMRNLGAVICVQKGVELLRRIPPTEGRNGYTVTGNVIQAKAGEWIKFIPGNGTVISDGDENLLLSDIAGMPKFRDQKM